MPHPTPAQIAYGSAAVISATLLLLLVAPSDSGLAVWLTAILSLFAGVVVALGVHSRRGARAEAMARLHALAEALAEAAPEPQAPARVQDGYDSPGSCHSAASRDHETQPVPSEAALRTR